jgi:hypothetical protein
MSSRSAAVGDDRCPSRPGRWRRERGRGTSHPVGRVHRTVAADVRAPTHAAVHARGLVDDRVSRIRRVGLAAMAVRSRSGDRPGDGVGDPGPARVCPVPVDRVPLLHPAPHQVPGAAAGRRTAELGEAAARRYELDYRRSFEPVAGKHNALNTALKGVTTPVVVTLDADTLLNREALSYLVGRLMSRPQDQHVCACAGALIAENAQHNFLTRMQGWDYRLGINGVKRTRRPTTARSSRRERSRPTGPTTSAPSAAGRMRSARTSSSRGP